MPRTRFLVAALLAALVLGVAACAESSSDAPVDTGEPPSLSAAGYDEAQMEDFRAALDQWNVEGQTWRLTNLRTTGTTRCGLGFDAAFPDLVLLTVINTSGRWFQVSIDPATGPKSETVRTGRDFNIAFGGRSPEDFFALTEPCSVERSGTVSMRPE